MNIREINNKYYSICDAIINRNVKKSFDELKHFVRSSGDVILLSKLENEEFNYKNLLNYTIMGVKDPEREKVFNLVLTSLLDVADRARQNLILPHLSMEFHNQKKRFSLLDTITIQDADKIVDDIVLNSEIEDVLSEVNLGDAEGSDRSLKSIDEVFYYLFVSDKYTEADLVLINRIFESKAIDWYEKSVVVTAITLSLQRVFDIRKFQTLINIYDLREHQLWQRALFGLIINLFRYDSRIKLYPALMERLFLIGEDQEIAEYVEMMILQMIRSKDTEKLARKMQDEIIPEMMKMKSGLQDKLDIQDLVDDISEDKNPNWEKYFEDSPELMNKLQEFSELQLEGADVFMSAFAMLKHFPFFNNMKNWFMPFYSDNKELKQALKNESEALSGASMMEGLESATHMCNSDKYSFMFNLPYLPGAQKEMISHMFGAELDQLKELSGEDNLINQSAKNRVVFTQYTQDLYRFFKLYPYRKDFDDVFNIELDLNNTHFFKLIVHDKKVIRRVGEYYFEKSYFKEAIELFNQLISDGVINEEIYEKLAFAYQKEGDYVHALEFYKKAELFDNNRLWNLKKIAFCYRKLGDSENALKTYKELEKLEPENLKVQASIGQALLDLKNFEDAVNYFHKIEFLDPSNQKIYRPLAWCSLVLGKYEPAAKYYEKILEDDPSRHDYLNYGHVKWCQGDLSKAADLYIQSVKHKNGTLSDFFKSFEEDKEVLVQLGISRDDISIMIDHVQYLLES